MKCTNGVDGVSAEEDGANVCTPNEFALDKETVLQSRFLQPIVRYANAEM